MSLKCKRCGGEMKDGIVLVNATRTSDDFGGDKGHAHTTRSEAPSDGQPVPCIKCEFCGHSFIPPTHES